MAASMNAATAAYCGGKLDDAAKQIATEINRNSSKFLEFIENLGEYLTNADNVVRGRATQLIGDVLNLLPPSFLASDQVQVVSTFLLSKLADHHSVQPHALYALASLTNRCNPLPSALPEEICRTVFREIQNQSLSHADRRATYMIIQNLLGSAWKALKQMEGDFVIGFIQQMDAEKDPRNLIICFNCAQFICSNMHLGPFAEEMFEVLGCYFPIDFTPPPNDPHGITKGELSEALRKCMAASAELAEYCLPLLLEKMTSDLQSARLEAFLTLTACAPVYGSRGLTEFLGSLTSSIKREALMNISQDLVAAARDAVKAVYAALTPPSQVDTSNDNTVTASIVELYQDINKYLEGTDVKKSCLAYSLCLSLALSGPMALSTIIPLVLPSLTSSCKKESLVTERLAYLNELTAYLELFQQSQSNKNVIEKLTEQLPDIFLVYEALLQQTNSDLLQEAVRALTILTTSEFGASSDKCDQFIDFLVQKSISDCDPSLRNQVLASLQDVIRKNPASSPRTIKSLIKKLDTTNSKYVVESLTRVVVDESSFVEVNDFLLNLISQKLSTESFANILDCTKALSQLLVFQAGSEACMAVVSNKTVDALLQTAVNSILHWTDETKDKCATFMSCFRDMFTVIGCSLNKSDTTSTWNKLQKLMLEGDTNAINLAGDFRTLSPFQPDSPWQQTRLTALLEGFVIGGDIQAMIERREAVFESAFILALGSEDDYSSRSACRSMAAIFNKAPIGSDIHWLLEPLLERLRSIIAQDNSLISKQRAVAVWVWMTKAMECRAHSAVGILSSHLISLLADRELGSLVADHLGLIVEDMDDIFTARLKGNITPLYKQRFFALNFKAILDGYHQAADKDVKQNYLKAISHITANLPLQVMKPQFPTLVPLLLLSLGSVGTGDHRHTLRTLASAVEHAPEVIAPGVDALIPQLLNLAKNDPAMRVRIEALKCLNNLTCLQSHVIGPYEARVVRELAKTLDDKKRLVRKQAVETRSSWIYLGQAPK